MIIFGHPTCVLIDTGSHRSYISEIFARHSDRQLEPLEEEILVTTPLGEQGFGIASTDHAEFRLARGSWRRI